MLSFVSKSKLKTHKVNGRLFGVSLTLNAQRSSADLFDSIQIDTETEAKAAEVERKIKKQYELAFSIEIGIFT